MFEPLGFYLFQLAGQAALLFGELAEAVLGVFGVDLGGFELGVDVGLQAASGARVPSRIFLRPARRGVEAVAAFGFFAFALFAVFGGFGFFGWARAGCGGAGRCAVAAAGRLEGACCRRRRIGAGGASGFR